MLIFAAATQGYFLVRSRWYEIDRAAAGHLHAVPPRLLVGHGLPALPERAGGAADASWSRRRRPTTSKRVWIEGTNLDGKDIRKGVLLPLGEAGPARERLGKIGLTVVPLGDEMQIAQVKFGSRAEKLGIEQGFEHREHRDAGRAAGQGVDVHAGAGAAGA